jgi:hypothetical protein
MCLILLIPFLPIAYAVGAFIGNFFPNIFAGYAAGVWLAVFTQAYLLVSLFAFAMWSAKRRR